MNPTQKQIIHNILKDGRWHCVTEFRDLHIPEYRSRLNTLKREGVTLEYRKCTQHTHTGGYQEVALAENAPVRSQNAPGKTKPLQDLVGDPSIIRAAAEASNQLQRDTVKLSQTQNSTPNSTIQPRSTIVPTQPKYSTYFPACCKVWEQSHYMHARSCAHAYETL
jgi:hypothetical protein